MTKKIAGYIRIIPNGNPELNVPVAIKRESTGVNVPVGANHVCSANPINTDAVTGYFEWTCELSPGPVRLEATTGSGQVKKRSGKELMQSGEIFVSDVPDMLRAFTTGIMADVKNEFTTTASGLNLTMQTGMANLQGRIFDTATNRVIAQGANVTLAMRNDILVLQQYIAGTEAGRQDYVLKVGTVSGVDPTLNTDPNILEFPLYRAALANGGSTPTLTDLRTYATIFLPFNSITDDFMSADGVLSTSDFAKILKAPTAGLTPAFLNLSIRELSDVKDIAANDGEVPKWVAANARYEPAALVTAHSSLTGIDTDTALTAIHHTLGAGGFQAAAGNHTHTANGVQSVSDTASIDLTLAGTALSAAAIFGTTATTIAAGNHNHSGVYAPVSHTHSGEATKIDTVVKGYSTTAVVADTAIATGSLFLSAGITYDVFIIGLAQAHMASGAAGNAQIGARWESGATDWGMQIGTELGERPVMIISVIGSVAGDSASHTYTLRGRSTGAGNANFVAATVGAFAIPRNSG